MNLIFHFSWAYMMWMGQITIAAQFIFRYFALCRGRLLSTCEYSVLMALAMLASGFFLPLFLFGGGCIASPPAQIYPAAWLQPNQSMALTLVVLPEDTLGGLVYSGVWVHRLVHRAYMETPTLCHRRLENHGQEQATSSADQYSTYTAGSGPFLN